MRSFSRRILFFLAAVVIIAGGYVAYRFVAASRTSVPAQFSEARTEGAVIAERIVGNSNEVAFAIAHLNENATNYSQVSSTIGEVLGKVASIRSQALELSAQLSKMIEAIPQISSEPAREAALQSVSQRLAVISNLITYTDQVTRLTQLLEARLKNGAKNTQEIQSLIREINAEVTAINNFNRAANESMDQFDSLLR